MLALRSGKAEALDLLELRLRIADGRGCAIVKAKIKGPVDADGCVEVSCVETVTNEDGQTIIFSNEGDE